MLVTNENLDFALEEIHGSRTLALDTETTGLYPWQNDELFSVIVATATEEFYFDFHRESGALGRHRIPTIFEPIFADPERVIHMLNAKFDMAFLYKEGVTQVTTPIVIDAMVTARLLRNDLPSYSMASLARWVGMEKSKAVEKWALENGAWEWETTVKKSGKTSRSKRVLYHKIPLEIVRPYGENDGRITYKLGQYILSELKQIDDNRHDRQPSILRLVNSEIASTKVLFKMEAEGALVDREYLAEAQAYEIQRFKGCMEEFEAAVGVPFKNSAKVLEEAFTRLSPEDVPKFKRTPKGKFSTKDEVISTFTSPLAGVVKEYRDAYKRAGTYFGNYMKLVDSNGRIHPNFRQSGTATGRLSCADPNLQNVTKSKDKRSRYPVRKCFIAPEDFLFTSFDYDQMEYRLMLDYAAEKSVIEQVLTGVDLHQATANMMGVDRTSAKTLNFMLLYGGGPKKLAAGLKVKLHEAKEMRALYFARLPKVCELIQAIIRQAEMKRMVFNWHGRIYRFPDKRFAYKAPNYLIQGGCSDIVKLLFPAVDELLTKRKARSRLILQVHDELDLYIHKNELDLVPEIRRMMESIYPHKHLPLTAGASITPASWADVEDFDAWMQANPR